MKKGQTWISAAIYLGIGIVAMTLILSAALPLIKNLRDENTVSQTKDLMANLDSVIRGVAAEGPGARRTFSIEIKKGDFRISADGDLLSKVIWSMETEADISEVGVPIAIGNVELMQEDLPGRDVDKVSLTLDYSGSSIALTIGSNKPSLFGFSDLVIRNEDFLDTPGVVEISITS